MNKLTEFAKNGSKDIDKLDLETGFVVNRKPARQWFNWLFNSLTLKINEIIDANYIQQSEVVDNLTTNDGKKPVSAKQAKLLNDTKLDKGNAFSDAYVSKVDIYQGGSNRLYETLKDLPVGKKALISVGTVSDSPFGGGGFVYIETKESYVGSSRVQLAYGYKTSDFAVRTFYGSDSPTSWKRMADAADVTNLQKDQVATEADVLRLQENKLDKTGNAVSATKLQNSRTVSFSGAATGSFTYDGSANGSCVLTLANSGVQAKTYGSKVKIPVITVNAKGLITGVSEQSIQEVAQATEAVSGIARVAKADEVSAGVADDLMITPKKLAEYFDALSFGVSQTLKNVTAERFRNVVYTNLTTKPITIFLSAGGSSSSQLQIWLGGNKLHGTSESASRLYTLIVLPQEQYEIRGGSIAAWHERS